MTTASFAIERVLREVTNGLKAGLLVGPGMIVFIAMGLAIAGAILYPIAGISAWNPLLGFADTDLIARTGAIVYGLTILTLVLEALRLQYQKGWKDKGIEEFFNSKAKRLWAQAPKKANSISVGPVHNPLVTATPEHPYSPTELSLVASTGVTSVRRGLQ